MTHNQGREPMAISKAKRRKINKANAQRTTGPRTPLGKMHASLHKLEHGMCSRAHHLPGEDAHAIADRRDAWDRNYPSDDPAADHHREECFHATLVAERANRYHRNILSHQARHAVD